MTLSANGRMFTTDGLTVDIASTTAVITVGDDYGIATTTISPTETDELAELFTTASDNGDDIETTVLARITDERREIAVANDLLDGSDYVVESAFADHTAAVLEDLKANADEDRLIKICRDLLDYTEHTVYKRRASKS